jgi:hypothetical protein
VFDSRCHWAFFFFNLPNTSRLTMALGFNKLLTEESTTKIVGGKAHPARKAEKLNAICRLID